MFRALNLFNIMFVRYIIWFGVFFERFLPRTWLSLQYHYFSTLKWNSIKCICETPRQDCVWAIVLRWTLRPIGLLFNYFVTLTHGFNFLYKYLKKNSLNLRKLVWTTVFNLSKAEFSYEYWNSGKIYRPLCSCTLDRI